MMKRSVPSASLQMTQKFEAVADRPDDYEWFRRAYQAGELDGKQSHEV